MAARRKARESSEVTVLDGREVAENQLAPAHPLDEKLELIRRTVARDCNDDELELFLHTCKRTGLDPLLKQIYAVKYFDHQLGREIMNIIVGIDGYRLVADRTGKYAPGPAPVFTYRSGEHEKYPISCTVTVMKQAGDGSWHEVANTAFLEEYIQLNKSGKPRALWGSKPHVMLAKCAEALALRKAFPAELSGVYTREELDTEEEVPKTKSKVIEPVEAPSQKKTTPRPPQKPVAVPERTSPQSGQPSAPKKPAGRFIPPPDLIADMEDLMQTGVLKDRRDEIVGRLYSAENQNAESWLSAANWMMGKLTEAGHPFPKLRTPELVAVAISDLHDEPKEKMPWD